MNMQRYQAICLTFVHQHFDSYKAMPSLSRKSLSPLSGLGTLLDNVRKSDKAQDSMSYVPRETRYNCFLMLSSLEKAGRCSLFTQSLSIGQLIL